MNNVEKWTGRLLTVSLIAAGFGVLWYMAALAAGGLDLMPELFNPMARQPVLPGSEIAAAVLALICTVFMILWLQAVWREQKLFGCKWLPYLFWLIFIPAAGLIFCSILLAVVARRRGWMVFTVMLVQTLLMVAAAVPVLNYLRSLPEFRVPLGLGWWWTDGASLGANLAIQQLAVLAATVAGIIFIALIPRLAGLKWPRRRLLAARTLLLLLMLSAGASYWLMARADGKVKQLENELSAMGVPIGPDALKRFYFDGEAPNAEWSAEVDRRSNDAADADDEGYNILREAIESVNTEATRNEATFEALRAALEENREYLCRLDAIFPADGPAVKYAIELNDQYTADMRLPQLRQLRAACSLYCARIRLAVHDRDAAAAMRLYRQNLTVLRSTRHEILLIGSLVHVACVATTNRALADMLSARILTDAQLAEIESDLQRQETGLRQSLMAGFWQEATWADSICAAMVAFTVNGEKIGCIEQPLRNPVGAPVYCHLQYELVFMLDIYKRAFMEMASPDFDPMSGVEFWRKCEESAKDKSSRRFLAGMLLPSLPQAWMIEARQEAMCRMLRIACEIERYRLKHRRLPASPDELAMPDMPLDPFNRRPFSYECGNLKFWETRGRGKPPLEVATATGYRLYSVGPKGANGGGKPDKMDPWNVILSVEDPGSRVKTVQADPKCPDPDTR